MGMGVLDYLPVRGEKLGLLWSDKFYWRGGESGGSCVTIETWDRVLEDGNFSNMSTISLFSRAKWRLRGMALLREILAFS